MNKIRFQEEQYLIRQAEIDLLNKTQKLLTDIVRSLSEEQLEVIKNLSRYNFKITNSSVCFYDVYLDTTINRDIDELEQTELKDIIDDILDVI